MSDRLRIAVWHNLLSGGAKRALYDHIQGLLSYGHYIEIWCPPAADIDYLSLRPFVKHHIINLEPKKSLLSSLMPSMLFRYDDIISRLSGLDVHCRSCASEINDAGFDLLFANSSSLFYNTPIGRYVNLPSLIYLGEPYRWLYEALPVLPWVAPPPWRKRFSFSSVKTALNDFIDTYSLRIQAREELINAQSFDRILVNSYFSRESVLRAYNLDSHVCYLGVDLDLFKSTSCEKKPYVVGLGAVYPLKRVHLAIEAIATIPSASRPNLIWIGNFSDPSYQEVVTTLAIKKHVKIDFKISVTDAELVRIISEAAVMFCAPHLEPFGYAALEANSCGTAVVAVSEGGLRETVKHQVNGLLVPQCSPIDLGTAISHFTGDLDYAYKMGEQSREHVALNWGLAAAQASLEAHLFDLLALKQPHY